MANLLCRRWEIASDVQSADWKGSTHSRLCAHAAKEMHPKRDNELAKNTPESNQKPLFQKYLIPHLIGSVDDSRSTQPTGVKANCFPPG